MTDVKTRPILFSGPMVRALLDGKKTQTRRVMKPQPNHEKYGGAFAGYATELGYPASKSHFWAGFWLGESRDGSPGYFKCHFGRPGDLLWVREKFRIFNASDECTHYDQCSCHRHDGWPVYYADTRDDEAKWRPSIHMPRWASRLTLLITDVRVERLQDITPEDALAEGVDWDGMYQHPVYNFIGLWDSINKKRGFGWSDNPWVWVVCFEVIKNNIDDVLVEKIAAATEAI